jgi:hypothetical protein
LKNNIRPLFSSNPISSPFIIHFEFWVIKNMMGPPSKVIYKTSLYSKGKDAMIKILKLKFL